ncbi:hypothetical protein EUA93_13465 [Nocardioides oleivorans]|uniref:Glycosyltransferase RgtA/B/C/D-like domain-containing protein n=1 Tax=Nocardioides oleivorans TaxID=273676 RepID=A0A4Q2S480_9ACTN|nr:hypothetical protein [Nocardioides oleivorans]RYB95255.1 hypothetical protein EUA93_13465 [Nocardioides oleivorans]
MRERLRDARWPVLVPVLVYLALALSGASYSSIGIDQLRETPGEHSGLMLGTPLSERSDEWATSTPGLLRVMTTGSTDDLNPLTADEQFLNQLPGGPVSTVVLFDRWALQLGPWLPDQVLYSATLWLPMLLLALGVPAWFRRITGSSRVGWLAVALLVLSPLAVWWSFGPIASLGPLFVGCTALMKAQEASLARRTVPAVAWGAVSALFLARTLYAYPPWSVVFDVSVLATTVAFLLVPRVGRGRTAAVVAATGAATLAAIIAVVLENRATLTVLADTVYPGLRRSDGNPSALPDIFAAPVLGVLHDHPVIAASNASEVSSSFGLTLVWVAVLAAAAWRPAPRRHRVAILVLGATTALWFAWSTLALGTLASSIPLLNQVPQARAADVVGMLGVLLLCLVLPLLPDLGARRVAVASALATGATTAYAGSLLRLTSIPTISLMSIYVASLVVAVAVFLITFRPRRPYGYVVAVAGAALLVWNVNPLLFGLADLRGSTAADELLDEAPEVREDGGLWASDAFAVDSLLASSGIPSLSGRQLAGPERDAWTALDPDVDESVWNRGGAFVWFQWQDKPGIAMENPSPDVILVRASPCTLAERMPALETIVATRDLDMKCLQEVRRFDWGGAPRIVYDVTDGS